MSDANHYVFVYGSLRSDFAGPAFQLMNPYFTLVAKGRVKGNLYDLGDYPAAVPATEEHYIIGELYKANSTEEFNWAMAQLDDYEGLNPEEGEQPSYYRALTPVIANDREYAAWVYWYNADVTGKLLISSGDVMDYVRRHNI